MRFSDLEPQWLTEDVIIFKCPACIDGGWASLKTIPMSIEDQMVLFASKVPGNAGKVHPCKANVVWTINDRSFDSFSATPSLDIRGHWHKSIKGGLIV